MLFRNVFTALLPLQPSAYQNPVQQDNRVLRNRHSCLLHTLLIASTISFISVSQLMAQTVINVKDLSANGVILAPSTAPEFSTQAAILLGPLSATSAGLLPYSLILKNTTGQTIRGYALQWTFFTKDGSVANADYHTEQNFDTREIGGSEIPPGSSRVISPLGLLASASKPDAGTGVGPNISAKLANYASITVSLDSVAFENGKVIGPNDGAAMKLWAAMYAAQRDTGAAALQKMGSSPFGEVVTWLQSQATQPEVYPAGTSMQERFIGSGHWYQVYTAMSARRLLEFSKQSSDSAATEAHRMAETPLPNLTQ
jgi:hypothetical protein